FRGIGEAILNANLFADSGWVKNAFVKSAHFGTPLVCQWYSNGIPPGRALMSPGGSKGESREGCPCHFVSIRLSKNGLYKKGRCCAVDARRAQQNLAVEE